MSSKDAETQKTPIPPHVPAELVYDFDYMEPILFEDPYKRFRQMACDAPKIFYGRGVDQIRPPSWYLTNYSDMRAVAQNPECFSSLGCYPGPRPEVNGDNNCPLIPLELDPPQHTQPRVLLAPLLSPKAVAAMEDDMRSLVRKLLDEIRKVANAGGSFDFVELFAKPLPSKIFCKLSGLPVERSGELVDCNNTIIHGKTEEERAQATKEVSALLAELIEQRRSEPKDDIISKIIHNAKIDGKLLADTEIMGFCFLLFLAGLDTVTHALGNIFTFLAKNPDQRDKLVENPALIPAAVEELLRTHGVIFVNRHATKDTEIDGVKIKQGEMISLLFPVANFNKEAFDDPETVDFHREADPHFTFGAGPHRCIGSHLARKEITISVQEFLSAFPKFRIADNEKPRADCVGTFGYEYVPLCLE